MHLHQCNMSQHRKKHSATGTRIRVARVRAEYPNQLDYSGVASCWIPGHTCAWCILLAAVACLVHWF